MLRIVEIDNEGNVKPVPLAEQNKRVNKKGSPEQVGLDPKTKTPAGKHTDAKTK